MHEARQAVSCRAFFVCVDHVRSCARFVASRAVRTDGALPDAREVLSGKRGIRQSHNLPENGQCPSVESEIVLLAAGSSVSSSRATGFRAQ